MIDIDILPLKLKSIPMIPKITKAGWSRWIFFANCWCFKTHCVVSLVEVVEGKDEEDGAGDHPREGWGQVRVGVGGQGRVPVGLPPYMSSHQFSTLTHCCWPPCKVRNTLRGNTNTQLQIKWDQIQKHKHWHTAGPEVEFVTPVTHGGSVFVIFAIGVNFSRNNAVCYINESKKLHFILISSLKLLTYY